MPYDVPPGLDALSLEEIAAAAAARRLPPVEQWQPLQTADSRMRIAANGTWYHDGGPITRPAMIRSFASLLVRGDDGQHALITPDTRHLVAVEDAAFIAVDMVVREGALDGSPSLAFRLNTDEFVIAGPAHKLRVTSDTDQPAAYLAVRHGCEARLDRSTWLALAEHGLANDSDRPFVISEGVRFGLVTQ